MSSAPPPLVSDSNLESSVSGGTINDDLFESALGDDDSGLDGVGTNGDLTESSDRPKTGSDTMEDFSLQDDPQSTEIPLDDPPPAASSASTVGMKGGAVAELDEDDDDDLFRSARLEPEMSKFAGTNGFSNRAVSEEPVETDIPLEDDDHPYNNPHLQLSSPQHTLTSFRETEYGSELENGDEFIEISVTSPYKVGEGINSYMAYKVNTKTNLSFFKKKDASVSRRFSDFLGLRDKLAEKYLQNGRIIPPAPDKSIIGMTKIKMSKEEDNTDQSDFVEKRRASLERYLNRTASHQNLRVDPDFREFLELDTELPRANQTSTLSSKNVLKMISKVGDKVMTYAIKMEETDAWFEDKTNMVENLDQQLRKLLLATEALVFYRKSLTGHTYMVSKSLAALGSTEENSKLSAALDQLSDVYQKVEKVHEEQARDDFFLLSEMVHDYIGIVGAVKDVLAERIKAWQAWQGVQKDLNRKREAKVKAELAGKQDKINEFKTQISETERQLDMAQENFEKISRTIKKEFEIFEARKNQDFKQTIVKYLERMLKSQENLVTHWERFLPEIKQMVL